jgi:predicted short-subunit dehydrogenase-like oxidoreductase (DUF2520 family)
MRIPIHTLCARNEVNLKDFPWENIGGRTTDFNRLRECDWIFLCISDSSLKAVSQELQGEKCLLIHTSGGSSMQLLSGKRRGVFYIPQTLTKGRDLDLRSLPVCHEADAQSDLQLLKELAVQVELVPHLMDSTQRQKLQLAAVVANNFTNHLWKVSEEWMSKHDLNLELLHPLIRETASKAIELGPTEAQTGPAIRGDRGTIKRHLKTIKSGRLKSLYRKITSDIFDNRGKDL